jgi:hypothetical protein
MHVHTLCGRNVEVVNIVKAGGAYRDNVSLVVTRLPFKISPVVIR